MQMPILFWIYLVVNVVLGVVNIVLYGRDKIEAVGETHNRTPVYVLISFPALGGAWGAFVGMTFFKHKRLKPYFKFANACALIIHIVIFVAIFLIGGSYVRI